mmetsp:Transcript_8796/g.30228  ORF Transcript_8796/g.30228 Transcript_8796/m.30228 type:complete len:323 (-) Transcript_8796:74-1042(-)
MEKKCVCVCVVCVLVLILILFFLGSLLGLWLVQELLWNHLPLLDEASLVPGPPVGVHLAQVVPDLLAEPPVALLLPVPLEAGAPVARELVDLLRLGRRGGRLLDGPPLHEDGGHGGGRGLLLLLVRWRAEHEVGLVPRVKDAAKVEVKVEGARPVGVVQKVQVRHREGGRRELELGGGALLPVGRDLVPWGLELGHDRLVLESRRHDDLLGELGWRGLRHHDQRGVLLLRRRSQGLVKLLGGVDGREGHVVVLGEARPEVIDGLDGGHVHHGCFFFLCLLLLLLLSLLPRVRRGCCLVLFACEARLLSARSPCSCARTGFVL